MTTALAFYDTDAEELVIGACLVARSAVDSAARALVVADFGSMNLAAAFDAILSLRSQGAGIDAATVADELKRRGTSWADALGDLVHWATDVPSSSSIGRYAEMVTRAAAKRALHGIGVELVAAADDPTLEPGDVLDGMRERLDALDSPTLVGSPGDVHLDAFVAEPDDLQPAVVPGLLAEDDRAVLVAPEGVGKSELARQVVVCASSGVHPFTFAEIPPVPALLVDLENPRALVRQRLRKLTATAAVQSRQRAAGVLWHRPGGIDLRRRPDRIAFEDVLRRNRPKLVSLGPVYKAYTRTSRESDEQVASEVQAILDDLRTRYGFALILEHHAPQANGGARDLRPFGSSLWLRWPEYGLKLTPSRDRKGALIVGRWRGDRAEADWPDELHRGDVWPWVGHYRTGIPHRDREQW